MKAFILAAGFGTRLRPLTHATPKPLLPVFGVPIIDRVLAHLQKEGFQEAVVNNHHLGEQLMEHLGNGEKFGMRILHSPEAAILGSGGGLGKAAKFLDRGEDCFLLHNGDVLTDFPLKALAEEHRRSGREVTLALQDRKEFNQVAVDENGAVVDIQRKRPEGEGKFRYLAYTGIAVINTSLLREFPGDREEDLINIYLRFIREGRRVGYHFIEGRFWEDVGNLASYYRTHSLLHSRNHASFVSPVARVAPSATLEGFYSIGHHASIGENCRLRDVVVTDGSVVPAGEEWTSCVYHQNGVVFQEK